MMKKRHFYISLQIIVFLFLGNTIAAQQDIQKIPVDSAVRYGKLDNGLTYYIRHNELPKQRAEFFIAQKVGSVLEEDNQSGLAHFLEHMAFNGTTNFPEKTMINYLETIGVKFGENLNAYTSFDETVYNISNVPVIREGIVDSCLLVLHDWSGFISLNDKEIERERGVIREEMRTRNHASYRELEKLLPLVMPGSQYAKRMPIGTEDVIMNFKPKELRDYYHKWYRPDLQGIIIVGDIDVDQVEIKIKKIFSDIPRPVNPAERIYYPVPDNEKPLVGIVTDKESTNTIVSLCYKHDPMPQELYASTPGLVMNYIKIVVAFMLNDRFAEMKEKANPPFIQARGNDGEFFFAQTKDAWEIHAVAKENASEEAFKAILQEVERAKKFGFTTSEYERAKIKTLKVYENAYNERNKTKNISYAREYADHFTRGGSIPGIAYEYQKMEEIAPHISLEYLNQYFAQMTAGEKNVVISLTCPEKEEMTHPSEEQFLSWYSEIKNEELQPYEDKVSNEPLMKKLPTGGKIISIKKDPVFETTNYILSNGIKVIIKSTNFKDDEIMMRASSPGGSSLFPEKDISDIKTYNSFSNIGGLSDFSAIDLQKMLSGKKVTVNPTINLRYEGFSGNASLKDFETMLQLIYLHFTSPRTDPEAFQSHMERISSQLKSIEANPLVSLVDTLYKNLYQSPERVARLKLSDMKNVDYNKIMSWRKDRYKDASDFTFVFVGNIQPVEIQPLIVQYLGSLPSINRKETPKDINVNFNKGHISNVFNKVMQDPKASVIDVYSGFLEPTLLNRIQMDMFQQILRIIYTEKIREDEGGTYSVQVSGEISSYPLGQSSVQISFDTNTGEKYRLNQIVQQELENLAKNGPRIEDFNKVKEFMIKKQAENEQDNNYWIWTIQKYYEDNYNGYSDYVKILQSISPENIQTFISSLLKQKNMIEVIMVGIL